MADFDGAPQQPASYEQPGHEQPAHHASSDHEPEQPLPVVQPESIAPATAPQAAEPAPQPARGTAEETAQEAEKAAARRRSTVREKVSFLVDAQQSAAATPAPTDGSQPEGSSAPAPAQSTPETATEAQPRKAGWWSRRFGGGE